MRAASEQSLRFLVEKWLAPEPSAPVRVTEFSRTRLGGRRYVRVETSPEAGSSTATSKTQNHRARPVPPARARCLRCTRHY